MAINTGKQAHAKKYLSQYEDKSHLCYEPERLVYKWRTEGFSADEIKVKITEYINNERQKCIDDVTYFAEKYGLISGPGGSGIIPFKLELYQKDLLQSFQHDKYVICNKARQLGVSTSLMFYSLWLSIFSTGKKCLVVAHRKESAEEYITKLKTAYEFLPAWLKPACTLYSKSTIEFETKSSVKAITSNPHAARSFSATVFLVDEAAFIPKCDEVIKGLMPTISASDGKLIAISTPNGNSDQNWFYTTFTMAKSGVNGWKWFELPWTVSSIFTKNPNFRANQIRIDNGNLDKFKQEYECFIPGTGILTDTAVTSIENIKVGDFVLSHTGRYRKVYAVMNKHYTGKMYQITSYGTSEAIVCTPEHPLRVYNQETQTYSWVEAQKLTLSDRVIFPKTTLSESPSQMNTEFIKLMAWYITKGSVGKNQVTLSLSNKTEEKNHVVSILQALNISYKERFQNSCQLVINSSKISDFFVGYCGSLAKNKKIPFSLISDNEQVFFEELMLCDGCYNDHNNCKKYSYGTISKTLAYQVQLLANSLDGKYAAGISLHPEGNRVLPGNRICFCQTLYTVNIGIPNITDKSVKLHRTNHGIAANVLSITTIDYDGPVYNFSVQHDESYVANGRIVHNCVFDVNLSSLFSHEALQSFVPSHDILNKAFGGVTYDDTLHIWKTSEPGERYTIGVDCASNKATAKDSTCFQVINNDTIEQHAEYIGKLPAEIFVDILIKTARHYNNALLIIESNTYSDIIFYLLEQKGYTNIWYNGNAAFPGFQTNRKTRPLLIEKLLLFFNGSRYMKNLRSDRLKIQMSNFSAGTLYADSSRKFEATRGYNDDAVLALALSLVELTPKEFIHKPMTDSFDVITETNRLTGRGDYSEEYLTYHSQKMGISASVLANRLKIYHEIKAGIYDGSGLEDMEIEHPVESFERAQSAKEFIGVPLITQQATTMLDGFNLVPTDRKFTMDDLFDPQFQALIQNHQNFLYNNTNFNRGN